MTDPHAPRPDIDELELLTLAMVAETLKLTRRTVERLIASKQLPVVRLSKKTTRVKRTDLHAFIASKAA